MKKVKRNFGFNTVNKTRLNITLSTFCFIFIIFLSVAFSAFQNNLAITNIEAEVRLSEKIRITGFRVNQLNNNATAINADYNEDKIFGDIVLPNSNSSVTYIVDVTNFGNIKMGIANITGLNSNLKYSITEYKLGEAISENEKYTLGVTKTFYITISYAEKAIPTPNTQSINLSFDFQQFYNVTYNGIPGTNHPNEVLKNTNLIITTNIKSIDRLIVIEDNVLLEEGTHYTYNEQTKELIIKNVTGNLILSYKDRVYIDKISEGAYFKEEIYKTKIKDINFVNYIDATNAIKTYDLSENKDNTIIGWITDNGDDTYNLYIGSVYEIYSKNLNSIFKGMIGVQNINFNNLNTTETTDFECAFYETALRTLDLSNFDTSKATSMRYMFGKMENLEALDLSNFDTYNVTDMTGMFVLCRKLKTLNLSSCNTSKVTNMRLMFKDCNSLTNIDISNFDTSNVTSMQAMFSGMKNLEKLNISNFNTSKVTDMSFMFSNLNSIKELDVSKFDTSNVTDTSSMFWYCNNLSKLDVSNFDTTNVTDMTNMFGYMENLRELDLSNFNTDNVTNMQRMFYYSSNISVLDFRSATFTNVTEFEEMFERVQSNIRIIVKDDEAKTWIQDKLGTDVEIVVQLNTAL